MNRAPTESAPVGARFIAPSREGLLLATVALGAVLAPLNSTMIAVALPGITDDLVAGAAATSWLVTAYLIAMASLQPVAGRLGDRLGRRRLILGGSIGFGLASLGATVAPNLPLLILCRVAQAVSGAVVLPNGDALLREIVPDERRASRFGMIGSAIGLAAAVGPPLGGILVSTAGWRAMFAVNLLLVIPALILGWRAIPRDPLPALAILPWGPLNRPTMGPLHPHGPTAPRPCEGEGWEGVFSLRPGAATRWPSTGRAPSCSRRSWSAWRCC
jgi:MFS family permease